MGYFEVATSKWKHFAWLCVRLDTSFGFINFYIQNNRRAHNKIDNNIHSITKSRGPNSNALAYACLLYTSDAADE